MGTLLLLVVSLLSTQTAAPPPGPPADTDRRAQATAAETAAPQVATDSTGSTAAPAADRLVPIRPLHQDRAVRLLEDALHRPADGALAGTEVTLYQILAAPVAGMRRDELIRAYWQLSAAVADYHHALSAEQRLERLARVASAPAGGIDADQFKLERATAQVRVAATRLAAVRAQHQLGQLRPDLVMTSMPLPADQPHTGGYRTLYDHLFAGQMVPAARRLNATLPLAHDLITARAAAVETADRLLTAATDGMTAGRGTATQALDYYRQLVTQQQALVTAIRDYNFAIAEYAQLVAPQGSDPAQLVAMLIKPPSGAAQSQPTAARDAPTIADSLPTGTANAPTVAGGMPTATAAVPETTGQRPVDDDGLISVLKRRPAAGATTAASSRPAAGQTGSGVVQATAEQPVDQGQPAQGAASAPASDSLAPDQLKRGP